MNPATNVFTYLPGGADWVRILPELILLGTALVVLLADLALPTRVKGSLAVVGLVGTIGSAVAAALLFTNGDGQTAFNGMVASDKAAMLAAFIVLLAVGLALLYSPGYIERQGVTQHGEYYALLLISAMGMVLMAAAANLMIVFVGLEVLSLCLYILSAYIAPRSRSQEAGMKYFILSSFASAFLLYGMALTYGSTGSTALSGVRAFLNTHAYTSGSGFGPLLVAGIALMAVGFCFKVSAVPFQAWTPDVYVGAPTPVTAFMSVGTKVAAFLALARVFMVALHPVAIEWTPVLWAVAILTMVGGNVLAVTQRDVKRMLAYSSVANAGYMLVAVVTNTGQSLTALFFYLAGYAAMNLGAFGVVLAIERNNGLGTTLEDFNGLARRNGALAALMALFLLALAGIPPTVGFTAKYEVFYAAIVGGRLELAIIGVLSSVLGMFYYLRVIWAMYFVEPTPTAAAPGETFVVTPSPMPSPAAATAASPSGAVAVAEPQAQTAAEIVAAPSAPVPTPRSVPIPAPTWLALAIAGILTLFLGIFPGPLYDLVHQAAIALFH